ncbi:MAG: DUF433 domain-containing protein [Candidatus Eisenbacteria sp.]|nr:DUF433 domain-containing protein [Candidatus Eisenbacteria bacterium]
MDWREHIATDSQVLVGKPVVRGTRLSVDFILGLLAEGWSEQRILENYPSMTADAFRAVYAYAAQVLGDEATYPIRRTGS